MSQRLLEGEVMDDGAASEVERLRDDLRRASGERDALRSENVRLRQRVNQIDGPAAQLRQTLEPLYQALRAIFGEIEVIDPQGATLSAPPTDPGTSRGASPVWGSWKSKLGGKQAEFITVLLEHGEMTAAQLRIACRCSSDTVYQTIHKLNKAGLLNKNGGRISLKQL